MPLQGNYEPSPVGWVADQAAKYEASGGDSKAVLGPDSDLVLVLLTTKGNKSGKIRKTPLMRVEHDGQYVVVASRGGAPTHPVWYYNLVVDPTAVRFQDGPDAFDATARELPPGPERDLWWQRAVEQYPPYGEYQTRTDRLIPVFLITRNT